MNDFQRNIFAASVAHASNHLFQLTLPAVLSLVMAEFNLSHYAAGVLLSSFSLPYALLQPPFGEVSDRFGRRKPIIIGTMISSAAMLLSGLSKDFIQILIFQFIAGASSAVYHPAGIPLISESSSSRRRGGALGVHQMGGAVGSFLAPTTAGAIARTYGWRGVTIFISMVGFLVTFLSWMIVVEQRKQEVTNSRKTTLFVLRSKAFLLFLGATLIALTVYRGLTAFAFVYVVESKGYSLEEAAIYYSVLQISGIMGGPIGGLLSDKFGRRNALILFVTMESVPSFFLPFLGEALLAIDFTIVGFASFAVLAVQDAYLSDLIPKVALGSSYGLLLTSSFLPAAFIPPIMGIMIDRNGYDLSFAVAAIVTVMSIPLFILVQKARNSLAVLPVLSVGGGYTKNSSLI
ncbi:MAG: MFS transporter [Thermoproteota archaeon]